MVENRTPAWPEQVCRAAQRATDTGHGPGDLRLVPRHRPPPRTSAATKFGQVAETDDRIVETAVREHVEQSPGRG